jgi:hypothetical protein
MRQYHGVSLLHSPGNKTRSVVLSRVSCQCVRQNFELILVMPVVRLSFTPVSQGRKTDQRLVDCTHEMGVKKVGNAKYSYSP